MNPLRAAARGQRAARRLMTDTCTISRLDYDHPTPGAGGRDDYPTTAVYAGPCRWRPESPADGGGAAATAGESGVVQSYGVLSVPLSATDVRADDVVELTCSGVPVTAKVLDATVGSQITARRIRCMVVSP